MKEESVDMFHSNVWI